MGRAAHMMLVASLAAGCLDSPGPAADQVDAAASDVDAGDGDPPGETEWQIPLGTSLPLVAIGDGRLVVVAGFAGTVELDPPITASGGMADVLLAGFDPDSRQRFARGYGGAGDELPTAITVSPADGEIAVAGVYSEGDGNLGGLNMPAPAGPSSMFAARYDGEGDHLWSEPAVSTGAVGAPFSLSMSGTGTVAMAGDYAADIDFGIMSATFTGPERDTYIARATSSGVALAIGGYGAAGVQSGEGAVYDGLGGVYLFGIHTAPFVIDEQPADTDGDSEAALFVCRLDEAVSSASWMLDSRGGPVSRLRGAVTADGSLLLTGAFQGSLLINAAGSTELFSRGGKDVFIALIDSSGTVRWMEHLGGEGEDEPRGIAVGPDGHIAVTGVFRGEVSLQDEAPLFTSRGNGDIFLLSFDGDQSLRWAHSFGDGEDDVGLSVAVDSGGAVVLGAVYRGEVDFGGTEPLESGPATAGALVRFR